MSDNFEDRGAAEATKAGNWITANPKKAFWIGVAIVAVIVLVLVL